LKDKQGFFGNPKEFFGNKLIFRKEGKEGNKIFLERERAWFLERTILEKKKEGKN